MIDAVVFDLDGVLVDSETRWDAARRTLVADAGLPWPDGATRAMMGMSAPEWEAYVHDELGVPEPPEAIGRAVVAEMVAGYREHLPLLDGAVAAVEGLAARWPMAVASSSNAEIIEIVLDRAGLRGCFAHVVSSEEVARGKPAPDVYLEAARRLGVPPGRCLAIEDSTNGLRSAAAAGMTVIAVPHAAFPPDDAALALAVRTVDRVDRITAELVDSLRR